MPGRNRKVPEVVVRRLPAYLRVLEEIDVTEAPIISSRELGGLTAVSPSQVRKDLTNFGVFGKQGVGYHVAPLRAELRRILRLDAPVAVGLIGAGHLGLAIARYDLERIRLYPGGTRIVAVFDSDPRKIGQTVGRLPILDVAKLEKNIAALEIKIIILTVPAGAALALADRAVAAGVKALLNFAPAVLHAPAGVKLHSADVGSELEALAYYA